MASRTKQLPSLVSPVTTIVACGFIGLMVIDMALEAEAGTLTIPPHKARHNVDTFARLAQALGVNGSIVLSLALLVPGVLWLFVVKRRRAKALDAERH